MTPENAPVVELFTTNAALERRPSLRRAGMGKSVGRQLFDTHLRQLRGSVSERRLPGRYAPDAEEKELAARLRHVKNKVKNDLIVHSALARNSQRR